ncbi:MAG: PKD domain-containing protein, partial [Flavitalea sp.]
PMKTMLRVFLLSMLCIPGKIFAAPSPGPLASFTADKTDGCISFTVNFTDASTTVSDPIVTWEWDFGDGGTSGAQHPTHTYTTAGVYDVKLKITTQSSATNTHVSPDYIHAGDIASLYIGRDTSICEGSNLTLDAGNSGSSYLWSTGENTQTIDINTEDVFNVAVTNNGCVKKDTIAVNFKPTVTPSFGFKIQNACLPAPVDFTDSSFACSGYTIESYSWDFGDGEASTDQSPSHTYLSTGAFFVKLTITDNIGTTVTKTRKVTIVDNPGPIVNLGQDTLICGGSPFTLDAKNPGSTYLWNTFETQQTIDVFFDGEYSVDVTMNGCTKRDTIYVSTGPTLYTDFSSDVAPGSCLPINVTFTEYSQSCNNSIVEWLWDFGDGTTSLVRNPVHAYTSAGIFTVTLTIKNGSGSTYQASNDVEIIGLPSPSVELGADTTVCEGIELVLDAGNAGLTIDWSTGENTSAISVYDAGKYTVTVSNTDGCSAIDSINVTIVPALSVDYSYVKVSNCLPVKIQFTDNSTSCGGGITDWKWDFGDGGTSTEQSPEHSFLSAGTFPVRLRITDMNGVRITKTKPVVITPLSMSVDLGNDTTICFGSTITLDGANPGAGYLWNTGETTQTIDVLDPGKYYVRVQINGCTASDTVNVSVGNPASSLWEHEVTSTCLPVPVNFTDKSLVYCGQTITEWRWDFGDGNISAAQNPQHSYMTADSFVVRLFITTSGGQTVSKAAKVYITNTPLTIDIPSSLRVCRNSSVQLDAGVNDADAYSWSPSIGISDPSIYNPILIPRLNGWYKVSVTKCLVTATDSVYITVDSAGKPSLSQNGNTLTSSAASQYEWYRDGQLLQNSSRTLTIDRKGYYSLKVFNDGGCTNMSDSSFFIPVSGKEKLVDGINVKCTPNPSSGVVQILLSQIPKKPALVSLIDRAGARIFSTTITGNVNTLNLTKFAKGLYYIEVVVNNRKKMLSVILY